MASSTSRFGCVAAVYDVHGNLPALDAVLADIAACHVDAIVLGGDYAWGPMPRECVERLMTLPGPVHAIRGNADREVAGRFGTGQGLDEQTARVNEWCADQLSPGQRRWLEQLPETVTLDVGDLGEVVFCHGSPHSDEDVIVDVTPELRLAPMLEGVRQTVVVFGHTHLQFEREALGHTLVNPGSVGLPFGAPGAYWAIVGPAVQLCRSEYDYHAAAAAFLAAGGPDASDFGAHAKAPPSADLARKLYG